MGILSVKPLNTSADRAEYIKQLLTDIKTLETMLKEQVFENEAIHIGAEQEFCLVNEDWEPSNQAPEILKEIDEKHFTNELTCYNLEINLDPLRLEGSCFSQMHKQLNALLDRAQEAADVFQNKIIITGILPTIRTEHMGEDYMTPAKRYKVLNQAIKAIRGADVELHIRGVDEINLHHDSIMYEGCNTSFQAHLQINPETFADTYNWAQAIAGPILSICTNSPMLMGRELWAESRIALFTQSVDTRKSTFLLNERESRVGFGSAWASGSPADFFKQTIVRFRSLITADFDKEDSWQQWKKGSTPSLSALSLHNGTVYPWNRLCYGSGKGKPHLRIENRYLPSGPTTSDEIANMMFWVGVMQGKPGKWDDIHTKMDFRDAKHNFFSAARYGMGAQFHWDGKVLPGRELLLEIFLPIAYKGLRKLRVDSADIERYLGIIENRIFNQNGSDWMVQSFRNLRKQHNIPDALKEMTASLFERSYKGYPVDAWKPASGSQYRLNRNEPLVRDLMSTRIITAQEEDSAALVVHLMKWNRIHHLPILNSDSEFSGLLSWKDVSGIANTERIYDTSIRALMKSLVLTIKGETPAAEAKKQMEELKISCLPVLQGNTLVGILTLNDFDK
ncbi:CBS domain-containing protein [Robiginitalea sp. IMCC44478]|uniref:CBS domain-containing protein n=1 Tax=Robiginitalea sp. IMCC44478 TaxID=3459122 RepID=UPI004042FCE7